MKGRAEFKDQNKAFWAYVRLFSEHLGYSERTKGKPKKAEPRLRRYTTNDLSRCLEERGLLSRPIINAGKPTHLGSRLLAYLNYRADIIESDIRPNLMNREQARIEFEKLHAKHNVTCTLPYNKQKRDKRHHAYLTCIANILAKVSLGDREIDDNPHGLIVVTEDGEAVQTLTRRLDGAFPNINSPKAIWEIKEYYGTTTFGSRIADGVYETMLDGEELFHLKREDGIDIKHYLMVDDYFTWWECGRSYLCRIVDILHMGLVDEVLFGREVLSRWPEITRSWITTKKA